MTVTASLTGTHALSAVLLPQGEDNIYQVTVGLGKQALRTDVHIVLGNLIFSAPSVAFILGRAIEEHSMASVVVRSISRKVSRFDAVTKTMVPIMCLRAWKVEYGSLKPFSEAEVFNLHCTDADGQPSPPEWGLEFKDSWEVNL